MRVKEKQNFSNKHSRCNFSMTFHEATVASSGMLHKQVSYPAYTYFWLPLFCFFFPRNRFSRNASSSSLDIHYQNSYHTTAIKSSNGDQGAKYKLSAFSKAVYHICKSKKI